MKVVILGAGGHGLSLAYHLVRKGVNDVTIVEAKRINYGSSGRNAGRFRYHFYTRENVEFAKEGIPYLLKTCRELPLNPLCMRTGYLWILDDDKSKDMISRAHSLWASEGVGGKFIPCRDFDFLKVDGECYLTPQDGSFHHDFLSLGLYEEIKETVKIVFGEATGVQVSGGRVVGVDVGKTFIPADAVAVTLGAWTGDFMKRIGLRVPVEPEKKEIYVTEDMKFKVKPLVISKKIYFSHTLKGEIVGGAEDEVPRGFRDLDVSVEKSLSFIRTLRSLVKGAEGIRVMRGWSGYYEMTPDHSHVMGYSESWPEGLYVDAGYSGHGMMFSPYSGKIMADLIADGKKSKFIHIFSPKRFEENKLVDERMVI